MAIMESPCHFSTWPNTSKSFSITPVAASVPVPPVILWTKEGAEALTPPDDDELDRLDMAADQQLQFAAWLPGP